MKERPRGDTAIKGIGFCPSFRHQDFNQVLNLVKIKAKKKPRSLGGREVAKGQEDVLFLHRT